MKVEGIQDDHDMVAVHKEAAGPVTIPAAFLAVSEDGQETSAVPKKDPVFPLPEPIGQLADVGHQPFSPTPSAASAGLRSANHTYLY